MGACAHMLHHYRVVPLHLPVIIYSETLKYKSSPEGDNQEIAHEAQRFHPQY